MTTTRTRVGYVDAAAHIGIKIGTLRAMVHRRQVPHIRLGPRLVVFDVAALDHWLQEHQVAPLR